MPGSILDPLWSLLGYDTNPAPKPQPIVRRVPVRLPTDDADAARSIRTARSVRPSPQPDRNSGLTLADLVAGRTQPRLNANQTRLEGVKSGALLGGGDEIEGAGGAVGNWLGRNGGNWLAPAVSLLTGRGYNPNATFDPGSGDFSKDFERTRSQAVKTRDQAYADDPTSYAEGYVPGFVASMALPGGRALKGETAVARARRLAAVGAGYGMASGALSAEPGQRTKGAAIGGTVGAVATPVVGAVIDRVAPRLLPTLGEIIATNGRRAHSVPDAAAPVAEATDDLDRILNTRPASEPVEYYPPQTPDSAHPEDLIAPPPEKTGLASGNGMDERETAKYRTRYWEEKRLQDDPNYSGPERRAPVDVPEPQVEEPAPLGSQADTPQGQPDSLTMKNGEEVPVDLLSTDGLKARLAEKYPDMLTPDNVTPTGEPVVPTPANDGAIPQSPFEELKAQLGNENFNPETGEVPREPVADTPANDAAAEPTPNENPETGGSGGGDEPPAFDVEDVKGRMIDALRSAKRLLPAQRELYRAARSERLGNVQAVRGTSAGEAGLNQELGQLSGELPKQDFNGVRDQFSQNDIDGLMDHLKDFEGLGLYGSIRARVGLSKLLSGQLPNASELSLLNRAFGAKFVKAAATNRTALQKMMQMTGNALNVPRSLMSSVDLSAPFRQGLFLVNRKEFWKAFPDMFKAFGSENGYNGIMDSIRNRNSYPMMEEYGLALSDAGHSLTQREEAFMSPWAEKIPVVGGLVRRSDRAYTGFLNKVRADTFDSLVNLMDRQSNGIGVSDKQLKDAAWFVNAATGRGSLGKFASAGPALNTMFFSPRLIASRVQLLNPLVYALPEKMGGLSPAIRKEATKSLLSLGALALTVTGLAKAGGLDVEADPRSSNFGKIVDGNTHYDILGGFGQYITLAARLASNQTKVSGDVKNLGEGYKADTRLDVLSKFGQSKLAPVPGFLADYLRGKDFTGEPFDLKSEAYKNMTPLFVQDVADAYKDGGWQGAAKMAVPGVFGIGTNTYSPTGPAPSSIKVDGTDVELPPEAREKYKAMVKSYLDVNIETLKKDGDWAKYSSDDRARLTAQIVKDGRKQAKEDLFDTGGGKSPAGPETAPAAAPVPNSAIPTVTPGSNLFDGFPGVPSSVRRTPKGNEKVGGVANSDHLSGDAVDFMPPAGMSMRELEAEARKYFPGMYVLNEGDHVHVRIPGLNGPLFGKRGTSQ